MITCEPFRAEHAIAIGGDEPRARDYEAHGRAFTLKQDGRVIACAGLIGAYLWSLTVPGLPLLRVHRATLRLLGMFNERIVAFTAAGNDNGCRWLELLGFVRETEVSDHYVYVREPR